jgi:hypothetical protein
VSKRTIEKQILDAIADLSKALEGFPSNPFVRERPIPPGTTHHHPVQIIVIENLIIGGSMSKFDTKDSVIGNQGDHGHGTVNNPTLIHASSPEGLDTEKFLAQLAVARAELKKRSASEDNPDLDEALGTVTKAEKQAKSGDASGAIQTLKEAGKWVLEIGKSVSVELLKDVIEG